MAKLENGLIQVRMVKSVGVFNRNEVCCFTEEQLKSIDPSVYSLDVEGSEDKKKSAEERKAKAKSKARVTKAKKINDDAQKIGSSK